jgi:hypothetical protein
MQLPLYETCGVCGRIVFGFTTGAANPPHRACVIALDRWIRDDNLDHCIEVFG